jgi:ribosomal protein S16
MTQVQRMTGRLTDWFVLGAQFSTTNYADKRIGSKSVQRMTGRLTDWFVLGAQSSTTVQRMTGRLTDYS